MNIISLTTPTFPSVKASDQAIVLHCSGNKDDIN